MARNLPPLPPPIRAIDRAPWKPGFFVMDGGPAATFRYDDTRLNSAAGSAAFRASRFIAGLVQDTSTPERSHRARDQWMLTPAILANMQAAHARMLTAFANGEYPRGPIRINNVRLSWPHVRRPPRIDPYA